MKRRRKPLSYAPWSFILWFLACQGAGALKAGPDPNSCLYEVHNETEAMEALMAINGSKLTGKREIRFLSPMTIIQDKFTPLRLVAGETVLNASLVPGEVTMVMGGRRQFILGDKGGFTASDMHFVGNGGAVLGVLGGRIDLQRCSFRNGTGGIKEVAHMNGGGLGAVYLEGGSGSIRGCHFYDNHALGGGGGALEFLHVTLTIDSTRFEHNSATGPSDASASRAWVAVGGAVAGSTEGSLTMTNCTFYNNTASDGGGALSLLKTTGSITSSTFTHNTVSCEKGSARYGGTLLIGPDTKASLHSSTMEHNSVYNGCRGGGVVLLEALSVDIEGGSFQHNTHHDGEQASPDDVYLGGSVGSASCLTPAYVSTSLRYSIDHPNSPPLCPPPLPPPHHSSPPFPPPPLPLLLGVYALLLLLVSATVLRQALLTGTTYNPLAGPARRKFELPAFNTALWEKGRGGVRRFAKLPYTVIKVYPSVLGSQVWAWLSDLPTAIVSALRRDHVKRCQVGARFEGRNGQSYEVIPPGRLGSGNFGTVLAVKETRTGALGVLKLFRKSTQDVFLLVREKNFLLQAARSNCRYLIRYVDDCSVGDGSGGQLLYLVLSPLCRETMEQRLTRAQNRRGEGAEGDYSYAVAVKYLMQAALAVRALHRRRIIHCDLALRNILLTYGDNIRLCDFGVAEDERKGAVSTRKRPWKNMSVSLAPEMSVDHPDSLRKKGDKKRGPRFDTRADCWSFGVLVYALLIKSAALAGERHLFPEARKVQVVKRTMDRALFAEEERREWVLTHIVLGCLEANPDERLDMRAVLKILRPVYRELRPQLRTERLAARRRQEWEGRGFAGEREEGEDEEMGIEEGEEEGGAAGGEGQGEEEGKVQERRMSWDEAEDVRFDPVALFGVPFRGARMAAPMPRVVMGQEQEQMGGGARQEAQGAGERRVRLVAPEPTEEEEEEQQREDGQGLDSDEEGAVAIP